MLEMRRNLLDRAERGSSIAAILQWVRPKRRGLAARAPGDVFRTLGYRVTAALPVWGRC